MMMALPRLHAAPCWRRPPEFGAGRRSAAALFFHLMKKPLNRTEAGCQHCNHCSGEDEAVEGDFQEFQDYDEF
uniref:Uncharacterized protein n=1 Tax=Zea mays TaxID=4577 RepID=A0A804U6J0_MAIZE